mmetsp:Transcript_10711/g.25553  ORF Transcript_10711/g.25553 Transcript_10711/m.25553 type:complete len:200 (+) Transcript_10711:428-1027(+)
MASAWGRAACSGAFLTSLPLGEGTAGALRVSIMWSTSSGWDRALFSSRSASTSWSSAACAAMLKCFCLAAAASVVVAVFFCSLVSCWSMPLRCLSSEENAAFSSPASLGKAFLSAGGSCASRLVIILPASLTSLWRSFCCASFEDFTCFFSACFFCASATARAWRPFSLCTKSCFSSFSSFGYLAATLPTGRLRDSTES